MRDAASGRFPSYLTEVVRGKAKIRFTVVDFLFLANGNLQKIEPGV
jgi:hypothetical protein